MLPSAKRRRLRSACLMFVHSRRPCTRVNYASCLYRFSSESFIQMHEDGAIVSPSIQLVVLQCPFDDLWHCNAHEYWRKSQFRYTLESAASFRKNFSRVA